MHTHTMAGMRRCAESSSTRKLGDRVSYTRSKLPSSRNSIPCARTPFLFLRRHTGSALPAATSEVDFETEATAAKFVLPNGLADYYEVLGVDDDASVAEIKQAYRALAKECHPDYLGDRGHDICILLNEAYETLSSGTLRAKYDSQLEAALAEEDAGYTGKSLSKWVPTLKPSMAKHTNPKESRAVFVDENTCIGCRNCVWCAPATFRMEQEHGRSRVYAQWLDTEGSIQTAIESCPVSCIHWVQKADLPALEYVMQKKMGRTNVGIMMSGFGGNFGDVFELTDRFKQQLAEKARKRAADKKYYSTAQQEARRKAAEDLITNSFMGSVFAAFMGIGSAIRSSIDSDEDLKVGKRKRASNWQQRQEQRRGLEEGSSGYSVPVERALVPISVYAREENY